jgi:low affinity Fe/Cu permease
MNVFDRAAAHISRLVGHPVSFALACLVVLVWAGIGPAAGYSDTWQLIINTSTTIVTFLMVFLIQNTQSRDNEALHLKIDELLRALDAADTRLVDLEERSEQELRKLHERYRLLANKSHSTEEKPDQSERERHEDGTPDSGPRNPGQHRRIDEPNV